MSDDQSISDYCSPLEAHLYDRVAKLQVELSTSRAAVRTIENRLSEAREDNRKLRKTLRELTR